MREKLIPCFLCFLGLSADAASNANDIPPEVEVYSLAHKVYLQSFPYLGKYSVVCNSTTDARCRDSCKAAYNGALDTAILYKPELELQLRSIESGCLFEVVHYFNNVRVKSSTSEMVMNNLGIDLSDIPNFSDPSEIQEMQVTLMMDVRSAKTQAERDQSKNIGPNDVVGINDLHRHGRRPRRKMSLRRTVSIEPRLSAAWSIGLVQPYASSAGMCVNYAANRHTYELFKGTFGDPVKLPLFATDDYDSTWLPVEYDPSKLRWTPMTAHDNGKKRRLTLLYEVQASSSFQSSSPSTAPKTLSTSATVTRDPNAEQTVIVPQPFRVVAPYRLDMEGFNGTILAKYMNNILGDRSTQSLLCMCVTTPNIRGRLATVLLSGKLNAYKIRSGRDAELYHRSVLEAASCESCKAKGGYWCPGGPTFSLDRGYFSPRGENDAAQLKEISPNTKCMSNPAFCPNSIHSCDGRFESIPGYVIREV